MQGLTADAEGAIAPKSKKRKRKAKAEAGSGVSRKQTSKMTAEEEMAKLKKRLQKLEKRMQKKQEHKQVTKHEASTSEQAGTSKVCKLPGSHSW